MRHADCDWSTFRLRVYVLLQLDQAVDGVSGETDRMLSSQVTRPVRGQCVCVWGGNFWVTLGQLYHVLKTGIQYSYIWGRKELRCYKRLTGFGVDKGFTVQHRLQKFMSVHKEDPTSHPPPSLHTHSVRLSPKLLTYLRLAQITADEGEKGWGFLSF